MGKGVDTTLCFSFGVSEPFDARAIVHRVLIHFNIRESAFVANCFPLLNLLNDD